MAHWPMAHWHIGPWPADVLYRWCGDAKPKLDVMFKQDSILEEEKLNSFSSHGAEEGCDVKLMDRRARVPCGFHPLSDHQVAALREMQPRL